MSYSNVAKPSNVWFAFPIASVFDRNAVVETSCWDFYLICASFDDRRILGLYLCIYVVDVVDHSTRVVDRQWTVEGKF